LSRAVGSVTSTMFIPPIPGNMYMEVQPWIMYPNSPYPATPRAVKGMNALPIALSGPVGHARREDGHVHSSCIE
jgi:hypothetical protein